MRADPRLPTPTRTASRMESQPRKCSIAAMSGVDRIAFLGLPDYSCYGKILPDLDRLKVEFLGYDCAGNELITVPVAPA